MTQTPVNGTVKWLLNMLATTRISYEHLSAIVDAHPIRYGGHPGDGEEVYLATYEHAKEVLEEVFPDWTKIPFDPDSPFC